MAETPLIEIAQALRNTHQNCQKTIALRSDKRLSSVIQLDDSGNPRSVDYSCRLPAGDGRERDHPMLNLPWEGIRKEPLKLTSISISVNCRLKKATRRENRGQPTLIATPTKRQKQTRNAHEITFLSELHHPDVTVTIDHMSVEGFVNKGLLPKPPIREQAQKTPPQSRTIALSSIIGIIIAALIIYVLYRFHN